MTLLATVNLHNVSGLPEDDCVNTFAFVGEGTDPTLDQVESWCNVFYGQAVNTAASATDRSVSAFLSNELSRVNHPTIRIYDIPVTDVPMGSPLRTATLFALDAAADTGRLPTEVACCLSFAADLTDVPEEAADGSDADSTPDRPASRRRGRVFIGPLNGFSVADSDGHPRPSEEFRQVLTGAVDLANQDSATGTTRLAVWSRKDHIVREATTCWVDDTFDTQRRRGVVATTRTTLGLT